MKNEDENNIININYPLSFYLKNNLMNLINPTNNNANGNIYTFNLKAVIQKSFTNRQKSYACCFPYNQSWYIGNGYSLMNTVDSPYNFNFGSISMLFYSSQN